jgi:hypothetical protein
MNKIYLFAIASILATASLMAGTFTFSAMAQAPTTPSGNASSTTDAVASNTTGTSENTTGTDNSTTPY